MTGTAQQDRGADGRAGGRRAEGRDRDDHRAVVVRAITPDDGGRVGALYRGLSSRARFLRFGSGTPPPSGRVLEAIVAVDGGDRVAVGAFAGDDCVGEARLLRVRPGVVEVAVTVAEGWRRRGLGHRLLGAGLDLAATRGEREVLVAVHPENRAALGLVNRTVDASWRDAGGLLEARVAFPLPGGRGTAAVATAGAGALGR